MLYEGEHEWKVSAEFADIVEPIEGLEAYQVRFRHHLFNLRATDLDALAGPIVLNATLKMMKMVMEADDFETRAAIFRRLAPELHQTFQRFRPHALTILRYMLMTLKDLTPAEYREIIQPLSTPSLEDAMTLGQQLFYEGQEKGLEQGFRQGRLQTLANNIRTMRANGASVDEISRLLSVSIADVKSALKSEE